MAKVLISENPTAQGADGMTTGEEFNRYWGDDPKIIFLCHYYEITRLMELGGYAGVRVIDIEDPKEVRVQWLAFSKSEKNEYETKNTNDHFFFINDNLINSIFDGTTAELQKRVLILKLLKESTGEYAAFFSVGVVNDSGGIGTGSPAAGAKVP